MAHRVDGYRFGEIIIDGKTYHHDVIIYQDKILDWWRSESHRVSVNDADKLIQLKPKTIIFGLGESGCMVIPQETQEYLKQQQIDFISLRTNEAYQKYNEMAGENVAAALHLTC